MIIEDEEDILELVKYNLEKEGYEVEGFSNAEAAHDKIKKQVPNLFILDLMLPGMDGLEFCKLLRNNEGTSTVPIIMLTAKGDEADIVTGLELGADDYVPKPFSVRVLIARIRAIFRRSRREPLEDDQEIVKRGDLSMDIGRRQAVVKGRPVDLTFSEFQILHFLAKRPGWVFTRYQIINAVHGEDYPVTDRSVDVQIVSLRKKLGSCGDYVETVRGVGYRFKE